MNVIKVSLTALTFTISSSVWGPCATGAINRIFGFLILAIAVQSIWDGVADFK